MYQITYTGAGRLKIMLYPNGMKREQEFSYYAFGGLRQGDPLQNMDFSYTGRPLDTISDLHYYRGRFYDSCTGTFTQVDPLQHGPNWYTYVDGNPVNLNDPSGYGWPKLAAIGLATIGYAYMGNREYDKAHQRDRKDKDDRKNIDNQCNKKDDQRDKYQHCMALCETNRNLGLPGGLAGLAAGYGRERVDWRPDASNDLSANFHGFKKAYDLNFSCHQSCSVYQQSLQKSP